MRHKMNPGSDSAVDSSGVRPLLIIQLGLLSLCIWLGLVLHYFRDSGVLLTAGVLLLAFNIFIVAALGLPRTIRRFSGSLMLAIGLMYLLNQVLPAAWSDGHGFVMLTLVSAALAVWLTAKASGQKPATS